MIIAEQMNPKWFRFCSTWKYRIQFNDENILIFDAWKGVKQFPLLERWFLFFDNECVVHTDLILKGNTINVTTYCDTLKRMEKSIKDRWPSQLTKGIVLLHNNATSHLVRVNNTYLQLERLSRKRSLSFSTVQTFCLVIFIYSKAPKCDAKIIMPH